MLCQTVLLPVTLNDLEGHTFCSESNNWLISFSLYAFSDD